MLFALLGTWLPKVLPIEGGAKVWIVRGGLWLLGLIAALLVYLVLKGKGDSAPAHPEQRSELDVAMAAARARLATARGKAGAQFGRLPILLVTGPASAAKTTIVARSGLQPDLLAGEIMRGDTVAPTAAVNVWFAQGNLVMEAGGRLAGDAAEWRKLVRYIQPKRLSAVMSRGKQAPRMVVVCLGCDDLLKPGASEAVPAVAQKLRARLAEVSQQLGIRLPVYVIFTKADRLPYFEDYVRSFTHEEARDVLGATLPVPPSGNVGHYAERETRRLANAFLSIFHGLALRRIDVLPRETQDQVKSGAYEFPREFRKITDLASLFLLELCRPSQLGVSPFLRGFYFTGVRPVLVHDVAAPAPVQPRGPAASPYVDATSVFDPRVLMQQSAAQSVPQTSARKVPEWVFLERVFRDVILRDTVAHGVTAGGTKVTLGRRLVLGSAMAALVFFSLAMTVSLFTNRRLLRDTRASVDGARSLAAAGALPDLDALQRLERLRVQAAKLNDYTRKGNPLRLSWGLYAGDNVQAELRTLYFRKFGELLWDPTRTRLVSTLGSLPASPNETINYDSTYDALKAYLVTAERPDSARRDFLAPVLTRLWLSGGQVDPERRTLVNEQFGFFADELPHGNPYEPQMDASLVAHSRAFLKAFSGEDQLYSSVLSIARESSPRVRWPDQTVQNSYEVGSEFTRAGWQRAQQALGDLPRLLNRETWVIGENVIPESDRIRIERALRQRYTQDYATAWTNFLDAGRVPPVSDVRDAAARLRVLASTTSPLIRMIRVASSNTAVDTLQIDKSFAPAHAVASPVTEDPTEAGGKYVQALLAFQDVVNQVASSSGATRQSLQLQAKDNGRQVKAIVNELTGKYTQGQAQIVGSAISKLLLAPVTITEAALGNVSANELNGKGAGFCQQLGRLAGRYPFSRSGASEANIDVVKELLAPSTGYWWAFYQDNLSSLYTKQGSRFVAQTGGEAEPTAEFQNYLNQLLRISNGMFSDDGSQLQIRFLLRMDASPQVPEITVNMEGRQARYTQTASPFQTFEWNGEAMSTRITARVGNQLETFVELPPNPWWVFRALSLAQVEARGADTYRVTWRNGAVAITGELKLDKPSSIFVPNTLGGVAGCTSRIAR